MKSSAAHYCATLLGMAASLCLSRSESENYIKELLAELPGGRTEDLFFNETSPEVVSILGQPAAFNFSWHNIDPETIPVSSIAYEGIAPDAPWRAEAEARISQHRKGALTLRITDAEERPIEGCAVELALTCHAYPFGTFFSRLAIEENEAGERYRQWMKDINENSILTDGGVNRARQDHYYELIQFLLDRGAPLGGIGMQGHFSEAVTPPPVLWSILDRFAAFGLPIRVTEYDLNTRDRAGQASYDRDFYTAVFAHPATVGITRWGFYEIPMWRPLGALIDRNGEYKPNGLEHRKLLFETWHTKESGRTDTEGLFRRDAFYGRYRVDVRNKGETRQFEFEFQKPRAPSCARPIQIQWTRQ